MDLRKSLLDQLPCDDGTRNYSVSVDNKKLCLPINIFKVDDAADLASRVSKFHKIPLTDQDQFLSKLNNYIREEKLKVSSKLCKTGLNYLKGNPNSSESIAKKVAQKYNEKWTNKTNKETKNCDFSKSFHYLVHSPAMEILLILENKFRNIISELTSTREKTLLNMSEQHKLEIDRVQENLGFAYTQKDVENLVLKQEADLSRAHSSWSEVYLTVTENQKKQFQKVVCELCEEMRNNDDQLVKSGGAYNRVYDILQDDTPKYKVPFGLVNHPTSKESPNSEDKPSVVMEESFTINLGAQLKTMHNIRLVVCDILNFCCYSNASEAEALRFQNAMTLYSNSLSAIVLLQDINSDKKFSSICGSSTECHFMSLEQQFASINATKQSNTLCEGDFYITTHSNLSSVQIAFHLIFEESKLQTITSRHPVVKSLKHVLKVASSHDINTITLPLLLTNVLTEDITFQWCIKRAELVMKCVKGFMMEMSTWDGGVSRNIQFVIPPGCSEEVFDRLRSNLPEVFRTTSARNLTPAHKKKIEVRN